MLCCTFFGDVGKFHLRMLKTDIVINLEIQVKSSHVMIGNRTAQPSVAVALGPNSGMWTDHLLTLG